MRSRFDDKPVGGDEQGNPYLVHAPRSVDVDRGLGALVGLAVGDAFGTTLEFQRIAPQPFAPLLGGPHREMVGQGPFRLAAGQVTDDSQMAVALARSLMERGGFRADAVGAAYVEWARHAFDIGNQTRAALSLIAGGTAAPDAGRTVWLEGGRQVAGNGSLMRTAPIAVFYQDEAARRREVSMLDSALTHFDPRCQLACAAFNGAIAAAIGPRPASPSEMLAAAREDLGAAAEALAAKEGGFEAEIDAARQALEADLALAESADPALYGGEVDLARMAGFVRVAFRLAFWHLVQGASFEAALIDVVNRGGDADTNGAITGALLGARWGASAIPAAWRDRVQGALSGMPGVWATTYHPARMFELVRQ